MSSGDEAPRFSAGVESVRNEVKAAEAASAHISLEAEAAGAAVDEGIADADTEADADEDATNADESVVSSLAPAMRMPRPLASSLASPPSPPPPPPPPPPPRPSVEAEATDGGLTEVMPSGLRGCRREWERSCFGKFVSGCDEPKSANVESCAPSSPVHLPSPPAAPSKVPTALPAIDSVALRGENGPAPLFDRGGSRPPGPDPEAEPEAQWSGTPRLPGPPTRSTAGEAVKGSAA